MQTTIYSLEPTVLRDGVDDASEAGARPRGRLVHALPQRLQSVHVDDGRGDGHNNAQYRRHQAEAAAQLHLNI